MKYNIEYYEKMLREYSATAEQISRLRWAWIKDINPKTVLDYGCGCGWFRAWRPSGIEVYSYDIADYPQTGIDLKMYDVVCFWDVLEHIPDFSDIEPILALARHIALTIPIFNQEVTLSKWKHFKPGEHIHYFTENTLIALFERYSFVYMASGTPECPPRKEVTSFLFKKSLL